MLESADVELDRQYGRLLEYPIPDNIIVTRRRPIGQPYVKATFHDLIYGNIQELIPNIELGLNNSKTNTELLEWSMQTKEYINMLSTHFQNECDKKIASIEYSQKQDILHRKFKTEYIKYLPLDINREIQSWLPPETRLTLLMELHPNAKAEMKIWKVVQLKTFYKEVVLQKYINNISEDWSKRCLSTREFRAVSTMSNKEAIIDEIFKVVNVFNNSIPRNLDKYYGYKRQALKLMISIIHITKKLTKPKAETKGKKTKSSIQT
jgi:hypothetical protein